MDHPKFIVLNQKEESISIQRVNQEEHTQEQCDDKIIDHGDKTQNVSK